MASLNNIRSRNAMFKHLFLLVVFIVTSGFSGRPLDAIFYIPASQIGAFIGLFLLTFFVLVLNGKWYIDTITLLLFLRLGVYLVPLAYAQIAEGFWGNYFTVIASFFAYAAASQNHNRDISESITKMSAVYITYVCLGVIFMAFYLFNHYGPLGIHLFKLRLVTPIGSSNYIASVILPFMVFIYSSIVSLKLRIIVTLLSVLALLATQSKGAIFVLVVFIVWKIAVKHFEAVKRVRNPSATIKVLLAVYTIAIILFLLFITMVVLSFITTEWHMGLQMREPSLYEWINTITSGRLDVYSQELTRWTEHILFGSGFTYAIDHTRSHNWIIDLLVHAGLFGFGTFIAAVLIWYKKIAKYVHSDPLIRSTYYLFLIVLTQGLIEVSLFTPTMDILVWFMLGLSVSQANYRRWSREASCAA